MQLPHQKANIASEDFQFLEDLATAYWYSEVLFAALELDLCGALAQRPSSPEELAEKTGCDLDGLNRLLAALATLGLIVEENGKFENAPLAARYLVPGGNRFAGDFLRYRRYLVPHWQRLVPRIRKGVGANERPRDEPPEAYRNRVLDYVRAMDVQARLKAADAAQQLDQICSVPPRRILDLGGGAGAWCRALLELWPHAHTVLLDLPETLVAARKLYPDPASWKGIELIAGNALTPCFHREQFDLIILSNILHAYGEKEARQLLANTVHCLAPGGMVVIHDYLADQHDTSPLKGRLYDLHMMLNTYNGRIYRLEELVGMLDAVGLRSSQFFHLETDTSILLAQRDGPCTPQVITPEAMLVAHAHQSGFQFARIIETRDVVVEPWVRLKCQYGCPGYASSLTCPPFSPDEAKMREILSSYSHALLVQGTPPSKRFHKYLLALERDLFLSGYAEALAFGAGPCTVCSECQPEGRCQFPDLARPSLEACGVDVYETARRAGLSLRPVTHRQGYVKFVGLVLFNEKRNHAYSVDPGRLDP
jgi:predicted metal-binding protein